MRIVLLDDQHARRGPMVRALQEASCRVDAVGSVREAIAAIVREAPQVIVVSVSGGGGADVVTQLRSARGAGEAFVLAVLDGAPAHGDRATILAAGAHDVVRSPIAAAELVARVTAPGRLIRRVQHTVVPVADGPGVASVSRLRAWRDAGALAAHDVTQMVGETLRVSDGWPGGFKEGLRGATIPMTLASALIEARVSVATNPPGRTWLAGKLLGDPTARQAAMDDVLRELANVAGGAVKRAALTEGVTLTTGLPVSNHAVRAEGDGIRCWTVTREDGTECIAFVGEIRRVESRRVPALSLREGMIVTHDLRGETGQLLIAAGSRLTSTTASRLTKILASRILVEVLG